MCPVSMPCSSTSWSGTGGAAGAASGADVEPPLVLGDLTIDRAARRVTRGEVEAHLTPTEFDLLVCLAATPRTVLSRERLLDSVWGHDSDIESRTVDVHIRRLRRRLGEHSSVIRTMRGAGYRYDTHPDVTVWSATAHR